MRGEIAERYFKEGHNCAESVALAFSDLTPLPGETLRQAVLPLGAGVGRLRGICGAVSGVAVCVGLIFPEKSKSELYALVQEVARGVEAEFGSVVCRELLEGAGVKASASPQAEERTHAFYAGRPCAAIVRRAAELFEAVLIRHGKA